MKMDKKSQHEITGFVLIIIIVVIIGVIFLSLSISNDEGGKTSVEISNFLQSSMYYTTNCAVSYVPDYKNLQDLIKSCYNGETCLDGNKSCDVLNKTFSGIIGNSFQVDEQGKNKAYKLRIYYRDISGDLPDDEFLVIEEGIYGNCSSETGASQPIFTESGDINVELNLCSG